MRGKELAEKTLNLEMTDMIFNWESTSHIDFEHYITGIDPMQNPQKSRLKFIEKLCLFIDHQIPTIDFVNKTSVDVDNKEHTRWGTGKSFRWVNRNTARFETLDDVWKFDPEEYFLNNEAVEIFEDIADIHKVLDKQPEVITETINSNYKKKQQIVNELCLVPVGYYRTLIMWPIMLFGWDIFLEGAGAYPEEFGEYIARFDVISEKVFKAIAATDASLVLSHDDLCMSSGSICSPEWYRKYIFPYYEKYWSILKAAGKKVVYVGDGNLDPIIDDIFACGADGAVFEPYTDLEYIIKKYGQNKIITGNIDNRILMYGSKVDIRKEVNRCSELGRSCPGYIFKVSNHITANLPIENVEYYFELCRENGKR